MKITIRSGEAGWIVYQNDETDKFHVFRPDEYVKLVEYLGLLITRSKIKVELK